MNLATKQIAIFYGSTTCYTEMASEKIQSELEAMTREQGIQATISMFDIKQHTLEKSTQYDLVLYGISTWDFGELQEDWESTWDDIKTLNLASKTVAIFGLGDQLGYADWFQDALGMLHDELIVLDCDIIGYWPNQGYEFTASKALTEDGDFFVGLSLDDENQYDLTDARVKQWCSQIIEEWTEA
ncbi:flavodoxin FldB [Brumicola pallidula]|jgi:flavodoxin II|uniref:Flavodoxin n=1 Tax=Brumicola pallidula DSM 14239 = ACAM 615 TaxID=1121922 RepID=K6ZFU2_9ALTE|nr:flavodoxin FldB [Glaciecola pallidula]GAC29232.1 flavodoxin II [Glaciecola pallidula DSM 14239 = ACAM 615]